MGSLFFVRASWVANWSRAGPTVPALPRDAKLFHDAGVRTRQRVAKLVTAENLSSPRIMFSPPPPKVHALQAFN